MDHKPAEQSVEKIEHQTADGNDGGRCEATEPRSALDSDVCTRCPDLLWIMPRKKGTDGKNDHHFDDCFKSLDHVRLWPSW